MQTIKHVVLVTPFIWLLAFVATHPAAAQLVLYVDDIAPDGGDGMTWTTALGDLQAALDLAAARESGITEIRVAQGTYLPSMRTVPDDPRSATFQLLEGVSLRGGYAGVNAGGDPDQRDWLLYRTILSGDLNADDGPDFENSSENAHHVVTGSGVGPTAMMEGLFVRGGNANVGDTTEPTRLGGGALILQGTPTISNCAFEHNQASFGGGMYVRQSPTLNLDGCRFIGNAADTGGGVRTYQVQNVQVIGCTFTENRLDHAANFYTVNTLSVAQCIFRANDGGLGGYDVGTLTMSDCAFRDNSGDTGGAMRLTGGGAQRTITRCEFVNNQSTLFGGALMLTGTSIIRDCVFARGFASWRGGATASFGPTTFINCVFNRNTAPVGGAIMVLAPTELHSCSFNENQGGAAGIVSSSFGPQLTADNTVFWASSPAHFTDDPLGDPGPPPTLWSCNIEGGWSGSGGSNIDADPLFAQAHCDNLRLSVGSPCLDAGDNRLVPTGVETDLDGNSRIQNGIVDIGAYEGPHEPMDGLAGCESFIVAGQTIALGVPPWPFVPMLAPGIVFMNLQGESATVWLAELNADDYPQAGTATLPATGVAVQISAPDGGFFLRVFVPFSAEDLNGQDPFEFDLLTFDVAAQRWTLATALNVESGGGRRIVGSGSSGDWPDWISETLGDYGLYWSPMAERGMAWANLDYSGAFAAGVPIAGLCIGDVALPYDGNVDSGDVAVVLDAWGPAELGTPADIDGDGVVDFDDLLIILAHWGVCP